MSPQKGWYILRIDIERKNLSLPISKIGEDEQRTFTSLKKCGQLWGHFCSFFSEAHRSEVHTKLSKD